MTCRSTVYIQLYKARDGAATGHDCVQPDRTLELAVFQQHIHHISETGCGPSVYLDPVEISSGGTGDRARTAPPLQATQTFGVWKESGVGLRRTPRRVESLATGPHKRSCCPTLLQLLEIMGVPPNDAIHRTGIYKCSAVTTALLLVLFFLPIFTADASGWPCRAPAPAARAGADMQILCSDVKARSNSTRGSAQGGPARPCRTTPPLAVRYRSCMPGPDD